MYNINQQDPLIEKLWELRAITQSSKDPDQIWTDLEAFLHDQLYPPRIINSAGTRDTIDL